MESVRNNSAAVTRQLSRAAVSKGVMFPLLLYLFGCIHDVHLSGMVSEYGHFLANLYATPMSARCSLDDFISILQCLLRSFRYQFVAIKDSNKS